MASLGVCILFWLLWSGSMNWPAGVHPLLQSVVTIYLGLMVGCVTVFVPLQTIFMLRRLDKGREFGKRKKHSEDWLARLLPTPFFGVCICWTAKRDGNGRPITDTQRFSIAISADNKADNKARWSELIKNRPTCEIPAVDATAVPDDNREVRILFHEQCMYLIAQTYPKQLMPLLNVLECAIYGQERASRW